MRGLDDADPLGTFAREARGRVDAGYYDLKRLPEVCPPRSPPSLRDALRGDGRGFPVVAEIKPASPTEGDLRRDADAGALARSLAGAGARGISALVERGRFGGSPENVAAAASAGLPVLFKDFVVSDAQLLAARRLGASAVLLVLDLHDRGLAEPSLGRAIARAHALGLETLVEVYDAAGLERAAATETDLLGVNQRDLRAPGLPVDARRAGRVLAAGRPGRVPILALSGIASRADVEAARDAGADAVLVGSALMRAPDPAARLRELMA